MRAVALVEDLDKVEVDSDVTSPANNDHVHAKANYTSRSTIALVSMQSQTVTVRPRLDPEDLSLLHSLEIMRVRIGLRAGVVLSRLRREDRRSKPRIN